MKVVVENIKDAWLRSELVRLGAKECPIEGTVVIDASIGRVSIRPALRTSFVLESGVIIYPGSPGEVCATFDGGYCQVVGLLLALGLLPLPIPDMFLSHYLNSLVVPA